MGTTQHDNRRILIVDDEIELLNMIVSILQDEGFQHIETAKTVAEALRIFDVIEPEIVILDVMLPDGNGYDLVRSIHRKSKIPIIFLTAKGEDNDRLRGLSLGADDYIVKPFLPQELILRLEGILRRVYPKEVLVYLQHCTIDFNKGLILRGDISIPLTATEFKIVETLNQSANRIVTIDLLCEAVWGDHVFGYENSLMAHIRRIREKIEESPSQPVSLLTVRGLGYKLITENKI
ncbi:response regulator transcription factor [Terribacillus saccharophilus]|uniref:DNA-binding response regulator n=1 Tax=Terribacillus saccharophilus TaxID=361277 RepID=A0A268AG91_9BACI|nr:response regulator transcription factor [Terribacillus saccharophilus]PAD23139.1 DNA-binding response regulator [Terribacillus saccharophilus]